METACATAAKSIVWDVVGKTGRENDGKARCSCCKTGHFASGCYADGGAESRGKIDQGERGGLRVQRVGREGLRGEGGGSGSPKGGGLGKVYHGTCWGCGQVGHKAHEGKCGYRANGVNEEGQERKASKAHVNGVSLDVCHVKTEVVPGVKVSYQCDAMASEDDAS